MSAYEDLWTFRPLDVLTLLYIFMPISEKLFNVYCSCSQDYLLALAVGPN